MIDFDDLDEIADERVKAGDDLDEAALAAISCAEGSSSKRNDAHEELSLDELLGRSKQVSAATIKTIEEERPVKGDSERARQHNLYDSRSTSSQRDTAEDSCRVDGTGDEPDVAALRSSWNPKPAGSAAKGEARSKRLSLCELSPSWTPQAPPSADEQGYQGYDASQMFAGLPTETTAAEATSAREEISSSSSDDAGVGAAAAAAEKAEPEPSAAPAPEPAPTGPQPSQWPARPDEAHFRILGTVLPMRLPREGMTPQEVARIWQEDWGVAYAGNLRFQAPESQAPEPESSSKRWLNPREDAVPCSPDIVQLEGKATVLNSLALSLRQHDERLKERSGAEGARRRLAAQSGGQAGGPDFGPRVRSTAAGPKRRVGPAVGRGTPFNRRNFGLVDY